MLPSINGYIILRADIFIPLGLVIYYRIYPLEKSVCVCVCVQAKPFSADSFVLPQRPTVPLECNKQPQFSPAASRKALY